MNHYSIIKKPSVTIVGIQCHTSNAPDVGPRDISRLWEKFYSHQIIDKIPHKSSNEVIALYCEYESDFNHPYTLIIGCPVSRLDLVPEEMVTKTIPAATYAVFCAKGEFPQSLIDTWGKIWQTDLQRTYSGDFECYSEEFLKGSSKEVPVCIAINDKTLKS